ncbi:MAG: LEA type 2 family protein [Gammaproteobacteria bacterium]|nr:LEA type 2 family protein [Gammaproteobacteria bacterium]MDH3428536.1 LEA type 2 family protein [Gammaproteobacteria bacterium]MDH3433581.1 LEA type 2 family protein [Gammaproteobacteria bacterium]
MPRLTLKHHASALIAACLLSACASTGDLISAPSVRLSNIEMTGIDFSGQTFVLDFDVTNPNPFPLPITAVSYGVDLDGLRFATGETEGGFTIPASGDGRFAISVELNLLKTAPQLMYIVRDGVMRDIPYALTGQLGLGIPLTRPVSFESTGDIRLRASAR